MAGTSDSKTPSGSIVIKVREHVLGLINRHGLVVGNKLPPERELAEACGCTRITLREALLHLEHEGYIYRKMRLGWFIAPPPLLYDPSRRVIFSRLVSEQNREGSTRLVQAGILSDMPGDVRRALDLPPGKQAIEIIRCRSLDGRPILLEEIFMDAERFAGLLEMDMEQSLTGHLQKNYGVEITREETRIRSSVLDQIKADTLSVSQGSPCLSLKRIRREASGACIEYNREYWLHNSVEITITSEMDR